MFAVNTSRVIQDVLKMYKVLEKPKRHQPEAFEPNKLVNNLMKTIHLVTIYSSNIHCACQYHVYYGDEMDACA